MHREELKKNPAVKRDYSVGNKFEEKKLIDTGLITVFLKDLDGLGFQLVLDSIGFQDDIGWIDN